MKGGPSCQANAGNTRGFFLFGRLLAEKLLPSLGFGSLCLRNETPAPSLQLSTFMVPHQHSI